MTETGHRDELQLFLIATLERYHDSLRGKLRTALLWISEAEHYGFVDLQYMCLYIAIERLRNRLFAKKAAHYIHQDWQAMLDGELAQDILQIVKERAGPLDPDQERLLISKLRGADSPPAPVLLDELCKALDVKGLKKDMGILRNKLMHTATYGNFDFPKVLDLHVNLSHVVDVCVLKILGYDGYYCHRATVRILGKTIAWHFKSARLGDFQAEVLVRRKLRILVLLPELHDVGRTSVALRKTMTGVMRNGGSRFVPHENLGLYPADTRDKSATRTKRPTDRSSLCLVNY